MISLKSRMASSERPAAVGGKTVIQLVGKMHQPLRVVIFRVLFGLGPRSRIHDVAERSESRNALTVQVCGPNLP